MNAEISTYVPGKNWKLCCAQERCHAADVRKYDNNLEETLVLASVIAVASFTIATPISVTPASAQVAIDTPLGGVRVGPQRHYDRHYDRRYRSYGYSRGYDRGCRTVTIERDDGSVRRVRRCG